MKKRHLYDHQFHKSQRIMNFTREYFLLQTFLRQFNLNNINMRFQIQTDSLGHGSLKDEGSPLMSFNMIDLLEVIISNHILLFWCLLMLHFCLLH